jgi:hypothetical protein
MVKDVATRVREPRRPYAYRPDGALKLDVQESQHLEMSAEPA